MAERHGTNSKHPRRRLAARRPVAAYGRTVQRCLLLILIASAPFLIGERLQSWDVLAGAGVLAHFAAFLKFDAWSIFAIIGITSPWILPMVGRSARVRGAFLLGSVAVHALLCQLFYVDFVCGLPNSVDALLGTVGVPGREGGPLGFLSWGRVNRQERTRATVTSCLARVGPTTPTLATAKASEEATGSTPKLAHVRQPRTTAVNRREVPRSRTPWSRSAMCAPPLAHSGCTNPINRCEMICRASSTKS
jgi:hypothetical protein